MTQAVLLMNLGTPSEPTAKGLRDFYRYFFPILTFLTSTQSVGGYCAT